MYSIKSLLTEVAGVDESAILSESIYCSESSREGTLKANTMTHPLNSFTFTLIREGTCRVRYNNETITLSRHDLYIYLPGLNIEILEVSDDYKALILFIDNEMVLKNIFAHDIIKAVYFPAVHYREPKVSLPEPLFRRIEGMLYEILYYQKGDNVLKIEASLLVFSLILIELFHSLNIKKHTEQSYTTAETYVIRFLQLLPLHYKDKYNIDFYARELQISKVYLSKIVKGVTGLTVIEHLQRTRLAEAERLLSQTPMEIKEIAYTLGFADHASFTKFFKRLKGISPGKFRG